jgi:vacuolar-type H+-ATPase subunit I/STV1
MIKISINGKPLDREFQNMAQALAFACQNGACYGAKVIELAQEGSVSKGGAEAVGGFTQADVDAACEKYCKEANEQLISQLEALNNELEETKKTFTKANDEAAVERACNEEIVALEEQVKGLEKHLKDREAEIEQFKTQLLPKSEGIEPVKSVDASTDDTVVADTDNPDKDVDVEVIKDGEGVKVETAS